MVIKITSSIIEDLSYEIIERVTRFMMHLDEIQKQFYLDESNVEDKLEFIVTYKNVLLDLLSMTIGIYQASSLGKDGSRIENDFDILSDILVAINKLHSEWLSILPRPSEPVELARFKRVIYDQIILLNEKSVKQIISISINEEVGEGITLDPLHEYKSSTLDPLVKKFKNDLPSEENEVVNDEKPTVLKLHITIPRIDAANTFRWASLIHEMAHSLMTDIVFEDGSIDNDFLKFCSHDQFILDYFDIQGRGGSTDKLKSWLTECWCDLIACILIGPSFYFSQYLVFINAPQQDARRYPPVSFRLYLIECILSGRFPRELFQLLESDFIGPSEKLVLALENRHSTDGHPERIGRLSNYFKTFFKNHFFASGDGISIQGNEVINGRLQSLVRKYVTIDTKIIKHLRGRLNEGLPIPSIKTVNDAGEYEETPSFVQEIFLASWMSRGEILKPLILKAVKNFSKSEILEKFYSVNIEEPIKRHDLAVLKSIQVSEWFDLFNEGKERPQKLNIFEGNLREEKQQYSGILVDKEIRELIFSDQLNVIPLMNLEEQIGTTSIDIRLGTGFQLFYPDQYGIVDFTDVNHNEFKKLSRRINLDFIEGITITPGQFLLGHSMEYIRLPDSICGNLEGRSSFARLGIEIHMTAGFIDPGFEGVITYEIYNAGANTVKLYPGMRIGQLRLQTNRPPARPYSDKKTVKYKGFLEHNVSRQNKDYEVGVISTARLKKNNVK